MRLSIAQWLRWTLIIALALFVAATIFIPSVLQPNAKLFDCEEFTELDPDKNHDEFGDAKLTVIIMSHPKSTRLHHLEKTIESARSWPFVHEVLLVWNGNSTENVPAPILDRASTIEYGTIYKSATRKVIDYEQRRSERPSRPPIAILPQPVNRVDNRWLIGSRVRTAGIFNMDDDVRVFVEGALRLYRAWLASPMSLVGIDHRAIVVENGKLMYSVSGHTRYNLVLPRGLVTSRQHLIQYEREWRKHASAVEKIVRKYLCDDIAFNFVAQNVTSLNVYDISDLDNFTPPLHAIDDPNNLNRQLNDQMRRVAAASPKKTLDEFESIPVGQPLARRVPAPSIEHKESHGEGALFRSNGMKANRHQCVRLLAAVFGVVPGFRTTHVCSR